MTAVAVSPTAQTVDWRLSPAVHGVTIGADMVLLDVADGTYLCLAAGTLSLALQESGAVTIIDPDFGQELVAAGLVTRMAPERLRNPLPPVRADLSQVHPPDHSDRACWTRMFRASIAAHLAFKTGTISQLLALGDARPQGDVRHLSAPSPMLSAEAARLSRLRVWAPFNGDCLARSYMALTYLRGCGHDAAWVVGVRTWPFDAHCWLQSGDVVLDDTAEHVRPYRPILVV